MSMPLLDANALIALVFAEHRHHDAKLVTFDRTLAAIDPTRTVLLSSP
jgi:predicted nucleic acid-binding protein